MAIRLFSPTVILFKEYLTSEIDKTPGLTPEYFGMLKDEIDAMRKRDPQGRRRSNQGHGWQSNDGIDTSPIFQKAMKHLKRNMEKELMGYMGYRPGTTRCVLHNSWANINYKFGWNAPHLHNGCFYSGVWYIDADGTEGNIMFIEQAPKFVGAGPSCPRMRESLNISPKTGDLYMFPSGAMHMVAPNTTDKDRYSISFNIEVNILGAEDQAIKEHDEMVRENMDYVFECDEFGSVIPDMGRMNGP
jgi:uncharacterized protein (TIGR02466 family)